MCGADCAKYPCGRDKYCAYETSDSCDPGYSPSEEVGQRRCTWVGGASCPSGKQNFNSMCYDQCASGFSMKTQGLCSFDGAWDLTRDSKVPERYSVADQNQNASCGGYDYDGGLCYGKCPDGLTRVAGSDNCAKDGIIQSYVPKTITKERKTPIVDTGTVTIPK
jgi:hypothetical protein